MPRDVVVAAAASVGVVAAARLTRLVTKDHWPPMAWARRKYVEVTGDSEWSVLAECPFCVAPYVVAAEDLTRLAAGWHLVAVGDGHGWIGPSDS